MKLFSSSVRGVLITSASVLIPVIFQIVYITYLSRNVDKNILGEYVLITSFAFGIVQIYMSVPTQGFLRNYHREENKHRIEVDYYQYSLFMVILGAFFVFIFNLMYSERFNYFELAIMYGLFFLISFQMVSQQVALIKIDRKSFFWLKLSESCARFFMPVVCYYYEPTILSLLIGIFLGYLISNLFRFMLKIKILLLSIKKFDFESQTKYLKYSYPIVFSALASWIITFSDRFFIDHYLNAKELGVYSLLVQFGNFAQVLGVLFTTYVLPEVVKKMESSEKNAVEYLIRCLKILALIIILSTIFVLLLPRSVFSIVIESTIIFNDNYYCILIFSIISVFLSVFQTSLSTFFILSEKLNIHARFFLVAACINFILNFMVKYYGTMAAILSTLITYIFLNLAIYIWIRHKFWSSMNYVS